MNSISTDTKNDRFSAWLSSGSAGPCCFQGKVYNYTLIRVEKNACFEYLYCQEQYDNKNTIRNGNFEYAGIYCRKDGLLYDAGDDLIRIAENPEVLKARTAATLLAQLGKAVREKVEKAIGNDRDNLQIKELTDGMLLRDLEYVHQYGAAQDARKYYLDAADSEHQEFSCKYIPAQWQEETLLSYIADPEKYIWEQAEDYIARNQEKMLYDFLCRDAVLKEYRALLADTKNPVHLIKKISAVITATFAKTVNVTIRKNGIEFTFKTEASDLRRDCGAYYSTWNIVAADRRKYEKLFGLGEHYTPEEIVRITYGKAILYEAEKQ